MMIEKLVKFNQQKKNAKNLKNVDIATYCTGLQYNNLLSGQFNFISQ